MKANKSKSVAASILVATSLVLGAVPANSAFATDVKNIVSPSAESQDLHIKYIGEKDGYVFLRITLTQSFQQKSLLQINDADGENLYKEIVNGKEYSRTIKVSPDEISSLRFTLTSNDRQVSKSFAINSSLYTTYDLSEVAE